MSRTAEYVIGAKVYCEDEACGELLRVVVDPIKRVITHIAVGQRHGHDLGRLVPTDLVEAGTEQELRLRCNRAKFDALEEAKEVELIPAVDDQYGYAPDQTLVMPYFAGAAMMTSTTSTDRDMAPQEVTYDKVPPGEVEVRRGQGVHASDGSIGRIRGFVVDPSDYQVTHVLLDEGHLWGKKQVSIPITVVTGVDEIDGVRLSLTKSEVVDLPPVEVDENGELSGYR